MARWIRRGVLVAAPLVALAAVVSAVLGGGLELAAAHGLLMHAALGPDTISNPVPFWG